MNDHAIVPGEPDENQQTESDRSTPNTESTRARSPDQHEGAPCIDSRWTSPDSHHEKNAPNVLNSKPRTSLVELPPPFLEPPDPQDIRPGLAVQGPSSTSTGSGRTLTPKMAPGYVAVALSTLQHLPVPLVVLDSSKRVELANEAMVKLLGMDLCVAEVDGGSTPESLRGQSLSQLGVELAEHDHAKASTLDQYLESLMSEVENRTKSQEYNRQPDQRATLDVLLTADDARLGPKLLQRARMTITCFELDNHQAYVLLTFTDIVCSSSANQQAVVQLSSTVNSRPDEVTTSVHDVRAAQWKVHLKEEDAERFKTLCDSMPQLVWTTTPDGEVDFCNKRWYEYTGLTEAVTIGHGWKQVIHPDDLGATEELFKQSLDTGKVYTTEYRIRSKEGRWKWFIARALPFRSKETGKVEQWFGTCTDANEIVEARREVERTWQQLLTVISHAQVTVFQVDTQRRVSMLEGAMVEEAIGGQDLSSRWYSGGNMYEIFGAVSKAKDTRKQRFFGPIETILAGSPNEILQEDEIGEPSWPSITVPPSEANNHPDGRYYKTHYLPIGVKDVNGHFSSVEGVIGVIRDVTDLKSKEADLSRQAQEKQQLVASEAAAKEASKLKSQFLANMSHEIRTPITGVIGMAELLLDLELGDEQREYTENIYRSANALLTVINDILDFSKVESGRLDIEQVQFSLSVIVRDVSKMLSFAAQRKNLDFSADIPDNIADELHVMGDPGRVRQIITNLLTNSIKFTNQGHVRFSVTKEAESNDTAEIKFLIEDTGIGIEEDVLKRLFVPFSQGDASTARRFGGTGLGLTICKSLLDLMHGRIELKSIVGSGTTATFWIPFKKPGSRDRNLVDIDPLSDRLQTDLSVSANSSDPEGLLATVPPELASSVMLDGLRPSKGHRRATSNVTPSVSEDNGQTDRSQIHILVVEDNAINQQIATKTIKKLGFSVSAAWNGRETLDYLEEAQQGKKRKPNVILMDVQMPVIDGYKCTHLLRYHGPYKAYVQDVPIVAMTASAIQGDREKCRKAGMDDYLAKPVRAKILELMLQRWTSPKRPDLTKYSSSHGSEVSEVDCSNAGEHCDSVDIPCVEHDDEDDIRSFDPGQRQLEDLHQPPLSAELLVTPHPNNNSDLFQQLPAFGTATRAYQSHINQPTPNKPPLTRSDTEEIQLARHHLPRNDSVQTTKRTTSNETDGDVAAQSRDVKFLGAAGGGPEQLPPHHVPSPEPQPGEVAGGEALTEANMEKHMQEEEYRLWDQRGGRRLDDSLDPSVDSSTS